MKTLVWWVLGFSIFLPPPPQATWVWPVSGPPEVLRDFRAPATPWGNGHRGLDLAASSDVVRAPVSGVVTFAGVVVDRGTITITTEAGHKVSLEPVESLVSSGDSVRAGQQIGIVHTGHCQTLCVHIGLRINDEYRSPRRELGILQRAVLLPWDYYALG
jgi:murein DD-endopeptidase MepM/ murein hydrolase activator NlpD